MMNPLTRWNQMIERHSLGKLFSRSRVHCLEGHGESMRVAEWIPLVEISEDAKGYLIKAELPQVKKEDVKITMEDGTLTITGDRKFEKNSKKNHRVERAYGKFAYSFSLPDDASPAKVTAEFKDGVLKVHLAKSEKANPGKSRSNLSRRKPKHERSKTEASPTPTK
jgi:HSP20 family protein